MTQYKSEVEYQRKKLAAEKWAEGIKCIMAQDGYMEIWYNSGRITRDYHKKGIFEVIEKGNDIEWCILHCPDL